MIMIAKTLAKLPKYRLLTRYDKLHKQLEEAGKKFRICEEGTKEEVEALLDDPSPYVRKLAFERLNPKPVCEKKTKVAKCVENGINLELYKKLLDLSELGTTANADRTHKTRLFHSVDCSLKAATGVSEERFQRLLDMVGLTYEEVENHTLPKLWSVKECMQYTSKGYDTVMYSLNKKSYAKRIGHMWYITDLEAFRRDYS